MDVYLLDLALGGHGPEDGAALGQDLRLALVPVEDGEVGHGLGQLGRAPPGAHHRAGGAVPGVGTQKIELGDSKLVIYVVPAEVDEDVKDGRDDLQVGDGPVAPAHQVEQDEGALVAVLQQALAALGRQTGRDVFKKKKRIKIWETDCGIPSSLTEVPEDLEQLGHVLLGVEVVEGGAGAAAEGHGLAGVLVGGLHLAADLVSKKKLKFRAQLHFPLTSPTSSMRSATWAWTSATSEYLAGRTGEGAADTTGTAAVATGLDTAKVASASGEPAAAAVEARRSRLNCKQKPQLEKLRSQNHDCYSPPCPPACT